MKVLIIEDSSEMASSLRDFLLRENYICEIASDYFEAEEKLFRFQYDCILLDIMLPGGNGLKLLKQIKSEQQQANVLVISAKNGLEDKVTGLEEGADDYITKPFYLPELHARIRAIYRRKSLNGSNLVQFNEISLNTNTLGVTVNGRNMEVTRKEFDLLLYFIVNKDRVLSRQSIAAHLWGDYTDDLANFDFVYQHVKNLRKKIGAARGNDYIGTVYGIGYKFNTSAS
jgi:DNA-binding response OmpR family regulator